MQLGLPKKPAKQRLPPGNKYVHQQCEGPTGFPTLSHKTRVPGTDFNQRYLLWRRRREEMISQIYDDAAASVNKEIIMQELDERVEKHKIFNLVSTKVDCALRAYQQDLEEKRERLRYILENEEKYNTQQILIQANLERERELQRKREREKMLKERRHQDNLDECQSAKIKAAMMKSSEKQKQKLEMEARQGQLYQMRERQSIIQQEMERERMWYDLMMKEIRDIETKDIFEAIKEKKKKDEIKEVLSNQIRDASAKKREEDRKNKQYSQKLLEDAIAQAEREQKREIERRDKVRADRIADLELRGRLPLPPDDDPAIAMVNAAQAQLQKEQLQDAHKKTSVEHEMKTYLAEYLKSKKASRIRDLEADKYADAWLAEKQREADERICQSVIRTKRLKQEAVEGLRDQLDTHARDVALHQQMRQAEREQARVDSTFRAQLLNARHAAEEEKKRRYAQDLSEQIKYNRRMKIRKEEEEKREAMKYIMEEDKYVNAAREKAEASTNVGEEEGMTMHPFARAIRLCSATRARPHSNKIPCLPPVKLHS